MANPGCISFNRIAIYKCVGFFSYLVVKAE